MTTPPAEELLRKIQDLEAGHAHLREEMSKLILADGVRQRRAHSVSPQRSRLPAPVPPHRRRESEWKKGSISFGHSSTSVSMGSSSSPLQRESKCPDELPPPVGRGGDGSGSASGSVGGSSGSSTELRKLTDKQCLNILQSMGQAVHIFDLNTRVIYW